MLEKKRLAMLQRCCDERQLLARIASQMTGIGDSDITDVFLRFSHDPAAPPATLYSPAAQAHERPRQKSVLGGVKDVSRGRLDLPAFILCLEAMGYLEDRGSSSSSPLRARERSRGEGGDDDEGREQEQEPRPQGHARNRPGEQPLYTLEEAQEAFTRQGQGAINFGTFRHLVMEVVRVRRQRAEEHRRTMDSRKRFGKMLPDLIQERRARFVL
jgi:hypothetical protein